MEIIYFSGIPISHNYLDQKDCQDISTGKYQSLAQRQSHFPSETILQLINTPIYSTAPTLDEWIFCDQLTRGHIMLNCTDVASLGVTTTGTAKDAWDSIQTEWGKSTDMRCSHAQEALNKTTYNERTDIQEHIKLL